MSGTHHRSDDERNVEGAGFGRQAVRRRRGVDARRMRVAVLALVVTLAACGGQDDAANDAASEADTSSFEPEMTIAADTSAGAVDASGAEGDSVEDAAEAPAEADAEASSGPAPSGGAQTSQVTAADLNRQIIYTATVEVDVDDVATAGAEAIAAIERAGGFVFGQDSTGGAEPRSVFVFKVRPADFDAALAAIDGIGELRNQVVSADDVTERVVDLESRIQVAALGVERLRAALDATTTLADFAEVERLLLERETELEVMRGQIRTLQDQVDLATITLILTQDRIENGLELTVTSYEEHNAGLSCPGQVDQRIEAGTDITVCFELLNTGDQALADLTLVDTGLGIDDDTELLAVYGAIGGTLQPGQSVIVAFETRAERDLRMRAVAGGQPVAVEGSDPAGPPVSTTRNTTIDVSPSTDAPGFGDGFESGTVVLGAIWTAVLVTVGFVLPLLALLPILVAVGWSWRTWRRRPGRHRSLTADRFPPPPMAPPAPDAPTTAAPTTPAAAAERATSEVAGEPGESDHAD